MITLTSAVFKNEDQTFKEIDINPAYIVGYVSKNGGGCTVWFPGEGEEITVQETMDEIRAKLRGEAITKKPVGFES